MEGGSWTQDAATSSAVRLCLSLAGALAGLHRRTSARGWEKLTAAGVGIFLDWLVCRPQFGEGTRGTSLEEFQHVMACVVEFANGVIRAAATESASRLVGRNAFSSSRARALAAAQAKAMLENDVDPDGPLWEDEVCVAANVHDSLLVGRKTRPPLFSKCFLKRAFLALLVGMVRGHKLYAS